jgi:hypothetical protein
VSSDTDAAYDEHMRRLTDADPSKATDPNADVIELTSLINLLVGCLQEGSDTPLDAELIENIDAARPLIRINLETDLAAVNEQVPAQLARVCRLPDRDHPDFRDRAEIAAGFFRTLANRYDLLRATVTLEAELRRHGLPSLHEQPARRGAGER